MKNPALFVMIFAATLLPAAALGQGAVYHWYDDAGQLHVTDQISDVPQTEQAAAMERAKDGGSLPSGNFSVVEGGAALPDIEPSIKAADGGEDAAASEVDDVRTRAYWQGLIAEQKARKAAAEADLTRIEGEIMHIKAVRPAGFHENLARLDEEMKAQHAIIEDANAQLKSGIAERARRLDIPPGWLR